MRLVSLVAAFSVDNFMLAISVITDHTLLERVASGEINFAWPILRLDLLAATYFAFCFRLSTFLRLSGIGHDHFDM